MQFDIKRIKFFTFLKITCIFINYLDSDNFGGKTYMTRSTGKALIISLLLGMATGCKREQHYTPQYLKPLASSSAEYKNTVDKVTILIKKLTYKDAASLFGEYIHCFYPDGPTASKSPQGIYPIYLSLQNAGSTSWIFDASGISLPLVTKHELLEVLYQRAPTIDHEALDFDITRKIIPYTSLLQPNETLNSLIFIKAEDWDPVFTIKLEREDAPQEIIFHVNTKEPL
jgi:hypothetical protein